MDGNRALVTALLQDPTKTIAALTQAGFPRGINVGHYGQFDPDIPPTPMTAAGRPGTGGTGTDPSQV